MKKYGFIRFTRDIVLGIITGGLWWLFLVGRALHNSRTAR